MASIILNISTWAAFGFGHSTGLNYPNGDQGKCDQEEGDETYSLSNVEFFNAVVDLNLVLSLLGDFHYKFIVCFPGRKTCSRNEGFCYY